MASIFSNQSTGVLSGLKSRFGIGKNDAQYDQYDNSLDDGYGEYEDAYDEYDDYDDDGYADDGYEIDQHLLSSNGASASACAKSPVSTATSPRLITLDDVKASTSKMTSERYGKEPASQSRKRITVTTNDAYDEMVNTPAANVRRASEVRDDFARGASGAGGTQGAGVGSVSVGTKSASGTGATGSGKAGSAGSVGVAGSSIRSGSGSTGAGSKSSASGAGAKSGVSGASAGAKSGVSGASAGASSVSASDSANSIPNNVVSNNIISGTGASSNSGAGAGANSGAGAGASSSSRATSATYSSSSSSRARSSKSPHERSAGFNSLFTPSANASTTSTARGRRSVNVVRPQTYNDVAGVAEVIRSGGVVVLYLAQTPERLQNRVLDFSFGVASALDAHVDSAGSQAYAITCGEPLTSAERASLSSLGIS